MIIKEIELRDFRNYESLNLQFHNKVNLFLGENAQGKTNILEAIYLSSLGRSFRTAQDNEMIRFGKDFLKVKVTAEKEDENLTVEFAVTEKGKGAKVDGVKIKRISELFDHIYTVIFSPEDLRIVKEDPEKRRRFLNTELCLTVPSYYGSLSDYKRVLRQRNAFLKEAKIQGKKVDTEILHVWDEQLSVSGTFVMMKRKAFVEKLKRISGEIHRNITDGQEQLEIEYEPSITLKEELKEQKEQFQKDLQENLLSDIKNATTGRGPHRDDIKIIVNGVDLRRFGSQGQQRTAALSLKLAEIRLIQEETGENAVLLLDDVMSELDAARQKFLVHSLGDVQLFITTTDLTEEVKKALPEGYTFYVRKGTVSESALERKRK